LVIRDRLRRVQGFLWQGLYGEVRNEMRTTRRPAMGSLDVTQSRAVRDMEVSNT